MTPDALGDLRVATEEQSPDNLPQLTDDDRAALESIPDDAVSHWWRGEKWNFEKKIWGPPSHKNRTMSESPQGSPPISVVKIDAKDLAGKMIMHVKIKRCQQWQWRIRIAVVFIRLAAWIMWVNVEIENEHKT